MNDGATTAWQLVSGRAWRCTAGSSKEELPGALSDTVLFCKTVVDDEEFEIFANLHKDPRSRRLVPSLCVVGHVDRNGERLLVTTPAHGEELSSLHCEYQQCVIGVFEAMRDINLAGFIDFGLARDVTGKDLNEHTAEFCGTIAWAAVFNHLGLLNDPALDLQAACFVFAAPDDYRFLPWGYLKPASDDHEDCYLAHALIKLRVLRSLDPGQPASPYIRAAALLCQLSAQGQCDVSELCRSVLEEIFRHENTASRQSPRNRKSPDSPAEHTKYVSGSPSWNDPDKDTQLRNTPPEPRNESRVDSHANEAVPEGDVRARSAKLSTDLRKGGEASAAEKIVVQDLSREITGDEHALKSYTFQDTQMDIRGIVPGSPQLLRICKSHHDKLESQSPRSKMTRDVLVDCCQPPSSLGQQDVHVVGEVALLPSALTPKARRGQAAKIFALMEEHLVQYVTVHKALQPSTIPSTPLVLLWSTNETNTLFCFVMLARQYGTAKDTDLSYVFARMHLMTPYLVVLAAAGRLVMGFHDLSQEVEIACDSITANILMESSKSTRKLVAQAQAREVEIKQELGVVKQENQRLFKENQILLERLAALERDQKP